MLPMIPQAASLHPRRLAAASIGLCPETTAVNHPNLKAGPQALLTSHLQKLARAAGNLEKSQSIELLLPCTRTYPGQGMNEGEK